MTAMHQRDVNDSEWYAKARLEPIVAPWCIDCAGGTRGLHDFEADLPNGTVAAVEVTGDMNSDPLAPEAELERQDLSSFSCLPSGVLAHSALTDCARSNRGW